MVILRFKRLFIKNHKEKKHCSKTVKANRAKNSSDCMREVERRGGENTRQNRAPLFSELCNNRFYYL